MFGLSDHDLMFSHGNEAGDEQDEDDNTGIEPENDYIQHRVGIFVIYDIYIRGVMAYWIRCLP